VDPGGKGPYSRKSTETPCLQVPAAPPPTAAPPPATAPAAAASPAVAQRKDNDNASHLLVETVDSWEVEEDSDNIAFLDSQEKDTEE